jgi:hypothetical protein
LPPPSGGRAARSRPGISVTGGLAGVVAGQLVGPFRNATGASAANPVDAATVTRRENPRRSVR